MKWIDADVEEPPAGQTEYLIATRHDGVWVFDIDKWLGNYWKHTGGVEFWAVIPEPQREGE